MPIHIHRRPPVQALQVIACAFLIGVAAAFPARSQPAAPLDECDKLAQPPRSAMGDLPALTDGVGWGVMQAPAAKSACARAMAAFPDEIRFVVYAARTADKFGNPREAARLYRIAADQGDPLAQNELGAMFESGEGGLHQSDREAQRLYRLSAEQDFAAAKVNLGEFYAEGRGGLRPNEREAVRLWQEAAEQGDAQAQSNLGKMYAEAKGGLHQDMREAVRLWQLSIDQGNTEAWSSLRRMQGG